MNHVLLVVSTLVLVASELDLFPKWFGRYFPLVGPESALVTLGLIEMFFTSYLFSDRHCLLHETRPAYLDKLLLATGIISGISGLFNILAVSFPLIHVSHTEFLLPWVQGRKDAYDSSSWNPLARLGKGLHTELSRGCGNPITRRARDIQERFQSSVGASGVAETNGDLASISSTYGLEILHSFSK